MCLFLLSIINFSILCVNVCLLRQLNRKHNPSCNNPKTPIESISARKVKDIKECYMTALSYKSTLPDEMIDIIFIKYLIRIGATSEELERAGLSPEIKVKGCFGTRKRETDNYSYSTNEIKN